VGHVQQRVSRSVKQWSLSPERSPNVERAIHLEREHRPVTDCGVVIPHFKLEVVQKHSRESLHLPVRELFSQADARTRLLQETNASVPSCILQKKNNRRRPDVQSCYLESGELEGALGDEYAVVVEPPFRPELLGISAPQERHPAHGVRLVVHHVRFLYSVAVRQRVVGEAVLHILCDSHTTKDFF
jgi:hypothetical protein